MITRVLLMIACLALPPALSMLDLLAEVSIERSLATIPRSRFILERELSDVERVAPVSPFPAGVLDDASLVSYSSWRMQSLNREVLRVEVYEMLDSIGAYGLLCLLPDVAPSALSQPPETPREDYYGPRTGFFWRGRYLIRVRPLDEAGTLSREEFAAIVAAFAEATSVQNLLPLSVLQLPEEGLQRSSIRVYLGANSLALNPDFPAPLIGSIGFEDAVEVSFSRTDPAGSLLFLALYPTPALAADYATRIQDQLRGFFSEKGVYLKKSGPLLSIFIGEEAEANRVLSMVRYAPKVEWVYDNRAKRRLSSESLTFLGLVTRSIIGTGAFIVFALCLGLLTGVIRYEVFRRYPALVTRSRIVRLNLEDLQE